MPATRVDVLIVGGGLIGLAVADAVAARGGTVALLERDAVASAASAGAAGMLAALVESPGPGPFLDLLLFGRRVFAEEAPALTRETGIDIGYRVNGTLRVAADPSEEAELRGRVAWERARELSVRYLDGAELREIEPGLSPDLAGALYSPDDGQVTSHELARALAARAARRGATIVERAQVTRLLREGDRVVGAATADGSETRAATVVLAAGPWSAELASVPLPVRPVKGQLIHLRPRGGPPLAHPVFARSVYLVPKPAGHVIAGATEEDVGFTTSTSDAVTAQLASDARAIVPALADARVIAVWAGLRPAAADRLPVIGRHGAVPGLIFATGHFRNGVLLSLATGRIVAALSGGEAAGIELAAFSPERFAASPR